MAEYTCTAHFPSHVVVEHGRHATTCQVVVLPCQCSAVSGLHSCLPENTESGKAATDFAINLQFAIHLHVLAVAAFPLSVFSDFPPFSPHHHIFPSTHLLTFQLSFSPSSFPSHLPPFLLSFQLSFPSSPPHFFQQRHGPANPRTRHLGQRGRKPL